MLPDRIIQVQLPLVTQGERCGTGERLRDGRDAEDRLRRHRRARGKVPHAEPAGPDKVFVVDDRDRNRNRSNKDRATY